MAGENYPKSSQTVVGVASTTSNKNSTSASGYDTDQALAANKTGDLDGELPVNAGCENAHALCHHVAHLTLIDGCENAVASVGEVINLDSDGMSGETQRSFTNNGSPSSCVPELEQQHRGQLLAHYKLATSSSSAPANHHHFSHPVSGANLSEQEHQFGLHKVGGNLIGVDKHQTTSDSDATQQQQQETMYNLKANQKANGFKNEKKIVSINLN